MYELTLQLFTAHILGDFVFQSKFMIEDIDNRKLKSNQLYLHAFIHFILILLLTSFNSRYILPAVALASSHLTIDIFTKIYFKSIPNQIWNFIIDQSLHFLSIAIFIRMYYNFSVNIENTIPIEFYLLMLSILILSNFTSIFIKKIMESFEYPMPKNGLKEAGKYIGILERLFVFVFVINNFWEGIGFLLAAKSIFRFGDLRENKDIKLTEYILIGTLISFGFAIVTAKLYLYLNNLSD